MLGELAGLAMAMARMLSRQVEAAGRVYPDDVGMLEDVSRVVRRTIALRMKAAADGRMTDAQRVAARMRQAEAAGRAEVRAAREAVGRGMEAGIRAEAAERGAPPSDTERLLCDMNERLLDLDIAKADTFEAKSGIILDLCKALGITPRREMWSHTLMKVRISEEAATLRRFAAGLKDPGVPIERPAPPPGGYPKIGRFTFGPTGAVIAEDPHDPEWAETLRRARKPPDSG